VPPGTSAAGFELFLYNGSSSQLNVYDSYPLDNVPAANICVDPIDGNTYYLIDADPIQNGAPDGMALVNAAGAVCEFISYEGTFTAASGPAAGMTSVDIGVSQSAAPIGQSVFLNPNTGMWEAGTATPKAANICFLAGTRILAQDGYTQIERLKVGDIVITASGKELPVKWIGIQSVDIKSNRDLLKSNPIRVKANAIEEGIPVKDLLVSPNHAIYVDGILINAGALVNGVNIYQEVPTQDFKYYHIELDIHELVIAENTFAESYLPQNEKRDDFDNAKEFDLQYPNGRKLILWPLDYPRISSQVKVPDYIKNKILRKEQIKKIA